MTRFARAKGPKASNERVPETATPWDVMKKDLNQSQNEMKNKKAREDMNKQRQETYNEFVEGEEKKVGKKWAEFPKNKNNKNKNQKKKVKKNIVTENDVTEEMIDDFVKSDEEIDSELKDKIETALKKQKTDEDDEDDGPEEKSSKETKTPNKKQQKRKLPKVKDDNSEHKRRKPELEEQMTILVNGEPQKIARFDGFPVLRTDFERLQQLRKSLVKKGVPQSEVKRTLQSERRKAEKYLSRLKKHVCFNCRKSGHVLSECPDLATKGNSLVEQTGMGICFKCGSTEHKLNECKSKDAQGALKFASCFICREQGHLARECPDNPRGLYPQGGACRLCGDVTHLKKDCPQNQQSQSEKNISLSTIADGNIESLDGEETQMKRKTPGKKVVKF